VRARHEAHLLEVGHHVADVAGESSSEENFDSAREPTGWPVGDVALDQDLQQASAHGH
jgi:hypothetical protein